MVVQNKEGEMDICANFGCGKVATKKVKLANGTVQHRCDACYARRIAASRAVKSKEKHNEKSRRT